MAIPIFPIIKAKINNNILIILDEPTSNLDEAGKKVVYNFIENYGKEKLVIVASNEQQDLSYCSEIIDLEKYK